MNRCYQCQKILEMKAAPGFQDICIYCGANLHCCFNCHYYSPASSQQCMLAGLEMIPDKKNANTCEKYRFREIHAQRRDSAPETTEKKWDELFPGL